MRARLDRGIALRLAAGALAVAIVGGALLLLPIGPAPWLWIGFALGGLVAPALASVALAALLRELRVLSGAAAVAASIMGVAAWALAAGAAAAWSLGFDEADAGEPATIASRMAVPLALAALIFGTTALARIWAAVLGPGRSGRPRWAAAASLSLPCAAAVGAFAIAPSGGIVAALAVLLAALRGRSRRMAVTRFEQAPVAPPAPRRAAASSRRWAIALTLLAIVGIACLAFAMAGAALPATGMDATEAMNAGLAAGSLIAVVIVACAVQLASPRWRGRLLVPALLVVVGLGAGAASQVLGADSSLQWAVLLLAALPVGAAAGFVSLPHLPGTRAARVAAAVGVGAAAAVVAGVPVVITAPFWAPLIAVVAVVLVARQRSGASGSAPQPASA